jgi:hypothetical protein
LQYLRLRETRNPPQLNASFSMTYSNLYIPNYEDVAFFKEHGWWISPIILTDELLKVLSQGVERYLVGERDHQLWSGLSYQENNVATFEQHDYVSLQIDEVRDFIKHPQLPSIASTLVSSNEIRLFHDQLVIKPPISEGSAIGWHTDRAYWKSCSSDRMITAWVPLQDVSVEDGTLVVLDRSHNWPNPESRNGFHDGIFEYTDNWVPLELKRGSVSFHHCALVHGSPANLGRKSRAAFTIHYQDSNNHWRPIDTNGKPAAHVSDLLCRRDKVGNPDYADPYVFPILWPEEI